MNSQLDQFCALFHNENELQDQLAELFNRLDGITGVRKLQGVTERGKDIVFYSLGPFGKKRLNACVVKNTSITGSVASQTGARTVLFQAQQAFDTPYINSAGAEEWVEHVYVISPRPSSPDSIESIKGALQHRMGQTTFMCGNELLDVFKLEWPDFLAFEGDFLGRYLNDLRLHLDTNPIQSALVLRHSIVEPAAQLLTEIYVPQRLLVELCELKTKSLSWYSDLLSSKVNLSEMEDAVFNLGNLAGLLLNARIWHQSNSTEFAAAARVLRDVGNDLPRWWETAYRDIFLQYDKNPPSRASAQVLLRPDNSAIPQQYKDAIGLAKECWQALKNLLSNNQPLIRRMPRDTLGIVLNPLYPLHCALIEAADRSPLAIEKSVDGITKHITVEQYARMEQSFLITAPAGFGKTSFCRYHALSDADKLLSNRGDVLPIYVPLHQIADRTISEFNDLFANSLQLKDLLSSNNSEAGPFKRVRLYLDGLDEVADLDQRRRIVNSALSSRIAWPVQVIVTAREHAYDDYIAVLPRLRLSSFSDNESKQFVRKWLKSSPETIISFEAELARHAPLVDLMSVPLLATLIIGVFRKTSRLPKTKVELYEIFVDLLCGGWDLVKNVQRHGRFATHEKLNVLTTLAGQLHAQQLRHAVLNDLGIALRFSMNKLEEDPDAVLQEILQDGLLIRSGRIFLFSHFSFQEYLTAKSLVDPTGKKQAMALRRYLLGDDWWKEVIGYYIGLLGNPHLAHEWIGSTVRGMLKSINSSVQSEIRRRCSSLEIELATAYPLFRAPSILK